MSKYVVCVFDDEETAYKASKALQDLEAEGHLIGYAGGIIGKAENGSVQIVDAVDEGPVGTPTGFLLGTLIGMLGGPAGAAIGATAGTFGGLAYDLYNTGVDEEFLDEVGKVMTPGKYAVVGEVEEDWTTPLDSRMEELGGTVFRRSRIDVEDAQIEREIEATEQELAELDQEWQASVGQAKEKVHAKVEAARAKINALNERAEKKHQSLKAEADAKLTALRDHIAKSKDDAKVRFEKRHEAIKAGFEQRLEKLKQAKAKKAATA